MQRLTAILASTALLFVASTPIASTLVTAQTPRQQDGMQRGMAQHADDMHGNKPPVPPSTSLQVNFSGHTTTLSVADLMAMPLVSVHVRNGHTNADETYTGPTVADVLAKAGLAATAATQPTILHSSVIATGTDGYFVLFSAAELEPSFSKSQAVVAVMKDGLPNTAGGNLQLINTDEAKPARWVHGLKALNVVTAAPSK